MMLKKCLATNHFWWLIIQHPTHNLGIGWWGMRGNHIFSIHAFTIFLKNSNTLIHFLSRSFIGHMSEFNHIHWKKGEKYSVFDRVTVYKCWVWRILCHIYRPLWVAKWHIYIWHRRFQSQLLSLLSFLSKYGWLQISFHN